MKSFEITSVSTHSGQDLKTLKFLHWTKVTVTIMAGFDWDKDAKQLLAKLKAATELDEP